MSDETPSVVLPEQKAPLKPQPQLAKGTGLPPTTGQELRQRARAAFDSAWSSGERHIVLASRWDAVDTWARLLVALAASLSALSLVASNEVLTAVFAFATAICSALNAAWDPAQRVARHRRAARAYAHVERPLGAMCQTVDDPEKHNGGWFEELSATLVACEDALELAEDQSPPLNRLRTYDPYGAPLTAWGLRRLESMHKRRVEAAKIRAKYSKLEYEAATNSPGSSDVLATEDPIEPAPTGAFGGLRG